MDYIHENDISGAAKVAEDAVFRTPEGFFSIQNVSIVTGALT